MKNKYDCLCHILPTKNENCNCCGECPKCHQNIPFNDVGNHAEECSKSDKTGRYDMWLILYSLYRQQNFKSRKYDHYEK